MSRFIRPHRVLAAALLAGLMSIPPAVAQANAQDAQTAAQPDAPEAAQPAPKAEGPMTPDQLQAIARAIDPEATVFPSGVEMTILERPVSIIYDDRADRMRILTPVMPAENLPPALMKRMLQANFDAVLDARYAVAQGLVWSLFLHPLSPLDADQLISAIAQTVTAAETFGTSFTSGAMVFGGGDTAELHRQLHERLKQALEHDI